MIPMESVELTPAQIFKSYLVYTSPVETEFPEKLVKPPILNVWIEATPPTGAVGVTNARPAGSRVS